MSRFFKSGDKPSRLEKRFGKTKEEREENFFAFSFFLWIIAIILGSIAALILFGADFAKMLLDLERDQLTIDPTIFRPLLPFLTLIAAIVFILAVISFFKGASQD